MKDLHVHIERGEYNREWIERFIEKAAEMQLEEINLLEHTVRIKEFHPCFKEAREYSLYQKKWFDSKREQAHSLAEYKALIDEIKSKTYPVRVNFGLEVCWFEQHKDYIGELVSECGLDYVLGSVHWIDNWTFNQRKYQWLGKDVNKLYRRYYEMSNTLIESGIFDIIAHPDLISCHGLYPDMSLKDIYRELCKNAKAHGVAVEMNTSKGPGLNPEFLETAKGEGVTFSAGSDAHRPEDVGRSIKDVYKILKGTDIL
ncbi:MAG: PHP domain-containing protein [Eubacterium sp.]|nr:PHP domain-containing protein [Eubacterium sp.]